MVRVSTLAGDVEMSIEEFIVYERSKKGKAAPVVVAPVVVPPAVESVAAPVVFPRRDGRGKAVSRAEILVVEQFYGENFLNGRLRHGANAELAAKLGRSVNSLNKIVRKSGVVARLRKERKKLAVVALALPDEFSSEEQSVVRQFYAKYVTNGSLKRGCVGKLGKLLPGRKTYQVQEFARKEGLSGQGVVVQSKPVVEKPSVPLSSFPRFFTIDEAMSVHLEMIARDMVANKGKMTFINAGKLLGVTDGHNWRAFVDEFMRKKGAVASYFGAKDEFAMRIVDGKFHEVRYGAV